MLNNFIIHTQFVTMPNNIQHFNLYNNVNKYKLFESNMTSKNNIKNLYFGHI